MAARLALAAGVAAACWERRKGSALWRWMMRASLGLWRVWFEPDRCAVSVTAAMSVAGMVPSRLPRGLAFRQRSALVVRSAVTVQRVPAQEPTKKKRAAATSDPQRSSCSGPRRAAWTMP